MADAPIISAVEVPPNARFIDARSGPIAQAAFERGHVVGAVHADLERDLSGDTSHPEKGGRHPLPALSDWAETLGRWGLKPDDHVVVYDDKGNANAAARAWWMLRAIGHARVSVLDGGWAVIEAGALATETGPEQVESGPAYPVPDAWQLPTADADEVAHALQTKSALVLDVRSAPRYAGESEPIDPLAGHIEGADNLFFGDNLDPHGHFLTPEELVARYQPYLGDRRPGELIVHCGSGVTACHTLLALEHAGLPGARLYVGSWSEWCRSDRPKFVRED